MLNLEDFRDYDSHDGPPLPILTLGGPEQQILKQHSREVTEEELRSNALKNFLYSLSYTTGMLVGVGLAAPQVGLPIQVFTTQDDLINIHGPLPEEVAKERWRWKRSPEFYINPRIVDRAGWREQTIIFESCMSVPDRMYAVVRPLWVTIEYTSAETFERQKLTIVGFGARVVEHEDDHLRGVTVIDRAEPDSEITPEEYETKWRNAPPEAIEKQFFRKAR